jgi:antibiotic biosynthesis monooxygenase (ABM) superfamily enzyme
MNNPTYNSVPGKASPPSKHQQALMIWLAVFPTLTILNLILGGWLHTLTPVVRTFVLVTIAVPIISYGLMPQLQRGRRLLLSRHTGSSRAPWGGSTPTPTAVTGEPSA